MEAWEILSIIRKKNRTNPAWINRGLYRLLYNPTLYIMAYERLKSKPGNMTPGADGQTLDGYSLDEIQNTIDQLRGEQYHPRPVRRAYIPKAKGQRPLGVPAPRDKIVQECLRLILEAIYEPQFHPNSHGFRPGRSCHTALESLRRNWVGTKWIINTDLTACFDQINHHRLLDILREKIQDDRFINLIRRFLQAGYLENWQYHRTYSGTPQGSVISPILTNIYLAKLDQKLEAICQQYTLGKERERNPTYYSHLLKRTALLRLGQTDPALRPALRDPIRQLNQQILRTSPYDYQASSYTRVKFLRYADDVLIGVIGPKSLARQVLEAVATFLHDELKLDLNRDKTKIIHVATEKASFLGYEFKTATPRFRRRNLRRKGSTHNIVQTIKTTSGNIKLLMPLKKLTKKLAKYTANGQPAAVTAYSNQPIDHIIDHYNAVIRGWYQYYQLAENVSHLHHVRYVLKYSLAKTLAAKERSSIHKIFRKYGNDLTVTKSNGRQTQFFNQPLTQVKKAKQTTAELDTTPTWYPKYTQSKLLDDCALCGRAGKVEMHHVRHIRKRGQRLEGFALYMAAINRKQIPVCPQCHRDIHNGKYDGPSLAAIEAHIHAQKSGSEGPSL